MSVTVVLTVAVEQGHSYAANAQLAGYRATLQLADGSAPAVSVEAPDLSTPFEFADTAGGSYVASVARLDVAGLVVSQSSASFGAPDSLPVPEPVVGDAPGGITVSFK
jgi:hypothetical protein